MAQERDSSGRFVSKSDSGGGGESAPQPEPKSYQEKTKLPTLTERMENADALRPEREGLTEDEAATVLEDVIEEDTGASLEGYLPEDYDGDPDALREAMERLREDGSVEAATDALEALDDLDGLEGGESDSDDVEAGDPVPWEALSEKLGLDADRIMVTAKVQGEEVEIPLSEAVQGWQRREDYTRKTAEVAEKRRELESALEGSAARLQALDAIFQNALTPEQRAAVGQAYQRVLAERAALEAHHLETEVLPQEHAKLAEALEWDSEEDVQAGKEMLATAALDYGFEPSDLDNVTDHRLLVLLHDAAQWRQAQGRMEDARAEARANRRKSRSMKPGVTGAQKRTPAKLSEARKRLARTGSIDAAAAALDAILPADLDV